MRYSTDRHRDPSPIHSQSAAERLAMRRELGAPLVAELEAWMRAQRLTSSRLSW
ncbi:MAG: hypothetical protein ABI216_15920 [Devosia sp.]